VAGTQKVKGRGAQEVGQIRALPGSVQ